MILLMTGGTGFLGKELLKELNTRYERIYIITRNLPKTNQYANVTYIKGDLTTPDIFDQETNLSFLFGNDIDVLHAGAFYKIDSSWEDAYLNNVIGTQNLIYFVKKHGQVKNFFYVSTIAVAGDYKGVFYEKHLEYDQKFSSHYSKSKFMAEKYIRDNANTQLKGSNICIYRPGIIVGHSQTGQIGKIDGPYYFYQLFKKLYFLRSYLKHVPFWALPFNKNSHLPIIPVDHVALKIINAMQDSSKTKKKNNHHVKCYHFVSDELPLVKEMLELALNALGSQAPIMALPQTSFESHLLKVLKIPTELASYFFNECFYDMTNAKEISPKSHFTEYQDIFSDYIKGLGPKDKKGKA